MSRDRRRLFGRGQRQVAGDNSIQVQASGDLTVHQGVSFDQIHTIATLAGNRVLDELRAQNPLLTTGPEPLTSIARPTRPLIGRNGLLRTISDAPLIGYNVFIGAAGVGKTELAVACAWASKDSLIWWIRAESTETAREDFARLASRLFQSSPADPVSSVKQALSSRGDWLLVIDNAADADSAAMYSPMVDHGGTVLATSLAIDWPTEWRVQRIEPLGETDGAQLLAQGIGRDDPALRGLSGLLGGIPLALNQAAAVIATTGQPVANYISVLQSRTTEVLARGRSSGYTGSVVSAHELAVKGASDLAVGTDEVLRFVASCAPGMVPFDLLKAGVDQDALALTDAVAALTRVALLTPVPDGIECHPLTRMLVADQSGNDLLSAAAGDALTRIADLMTEWEEPTALAVAALPHCLSLCKIALRGVVLDCELIARVAYIAGEISYRSARFGLAVVASEVAESAVNIPDSDPDGDLSGILLRSIHLRGRSASALNRFKDAQVLLQEVVQVAAEFEDEILLSAAAGDLADLFQVTGNFKISTVWHERAAQAAGNVPDGNSRSRALAAAYANRANFERSVGRRQDAVRLLDGAYEMLSEIDPQARDLGVILSNRALALHEAGKLREALTAIEKAIELDVARLGVRHVSVARNANNKGLILSDLGKYTQATNEFVLALEIQREHYGQTHLSVATTLNNLGRVAEKLGDLAKARECFEDALEIDEELVPNSPDHATVLSNLAGVLQRTGEEARALRMLQLAYQMDLAAYGEQHSEVAADANNIGRCLVAMKQYGAAKKWLSRAMRIAYEALGEQHPSYANPLLTLGVVKVLTNDVDSGKADARRALKLLRNLLGASHPEYLSARTLVAQLEDGRILFTEFAGVIDRYHPPSRKQAIPRPERRLRL